jgi:hypothetical protein
VHTGDNGVGFEVDDVRLFVDDTADIYNNTVAFNDFRGSTYEQYWFGGGDELNRVSRNFGDNRMTDGLNPADLFHE